MQDLVSLRVQNVAGRVLSITVLLRMPDGKTVQSAEVPTEMTVQDGDVLEIDVQRVTAGAVKASKDEIRARVREGMLRQDKGGHYGRRRE